MKALKSSKKLIATIIVFIVMVSAIIPVISNATFDDFNGKISMNSVSGKENDNVTVNITTTADITTVEGSLVLKYDVNSLQYVTATYDKVMEGYDRGTDGIITSIFVQGRDPITIPAGTTLASITFKIKPGATTNTLNLEEFDSDQTVASAQVKVLVPATGISLDKQTLDLDLANNKTGNLVATVTPENTTDTNIVWSSSNQAVAKVSGDGKNATVTAVAKGTAEISATINGHKVTCNVAVSAAPLTSITLSEPPTEVIKNKEFSFTVTPNEGAEIAGLTWEANPEGIVTVDDNGTVHPLKEGEVTVTAKVKGQENITDSKTFMVKEIPLESIEINTADFELFLGDSKQLDILINPENTTDDVSNVKWESDSDAVIVDENGRVTAMKIGEANITATLNGKTATVKVTVPEVHLEGIQIQSEKSQLKIGETSDTWFDTTPEQITDEIAEMKITSSDENIVSVTQNSEDWVIKGVNPGKATITAYVKTVDGKEFTSSMEIEVLNEVYVPEGSNDASTEESKKGPMPNTGDIAIMTFVGLMIASAVGITVIKFKKNNSKH